MATRPSRTTRSSTATSTSTPSTSVPAPTRTTRKTSTLESVSTSAPIRRTTRSSRAATPATDSNPPSRPTSRASSNVRTSAVPQSKPLWNSSRNNIQSTTQGIETPPPAAAKRTSLAVPKARTGASGLLRKMTSRDSMRPPPTPAQQPSRIAVPSTPAYRESAIGTFEGSREPIRVSFWIVSSDSRSIFTKHRTFLPGLLAHSTTSSWIVDGKLHADYRRQ